MTTSKVPVASLALGSAQPEVRRPETRHASVTGPAQYIHRKLAILAASADDRGAAPAGRSAHKNTWTTAYILLALPR